MVSLVLPALLCIFVQQLGPLWGWLDSHGPVEQAGFWAMWSLIFQFASSRGSQNSWATSQEKKHKKSSPQNPGLRTGAARLPTAFYWWSKFPVEPRLRGLRNKLHLLLREAEKSHHKGMSVQDWNNCSHVCIPHVYQLIYPVNQEAETISSLYVRLLQEL